MMLPGNFPAGIPGKFQKFHSRECFFNSRELPGKASDENGKKRWWKIIYLTYVHFRGIKTILAHCVQKVNENYVNVSKKATAYDITALREIMSIWILVHSFLCFILWFEICLTSLKGLYPSQQSICRCGARHPWESFSAEKLHTLCCSSNRRRA